MKPPVLHPDDQEEILSCPGHMDLQEGKNMSSLEGEAQFYRDVARRRIQLYGG